MSKQPEAQWLYDRNAAALHGCPFQCQVLVSNDWLDVIRSADLGWT
jgi:hypothetical protein